MPINSYCDIFMRRFALVAIRIYQRYLSPYKRFCCAYHRHTGRASCSALGYRAVRRKGVRSGVRMLRRRVYLCGVAHRRHLLASPSIHRRPPLAQRGDCDLGCDSPRDCHLPQGKIAEALLSCCDCGSCDWPQRRRKKGESESTIHLPPKRKPKSE